MTLHKILLKYYPDSQYVIYGENDLHWHSENIPKPTEEEIKELFLKYESDILLEKCKSDCKELIEKTDYLILSDVKIENKKEIIEYRKKLRNLILNPIENPEIPEIPEIKIIDTFEKSDLLETIKRIFKK